MAADAVIMAFGFNPHAMPWLQAQGVETDDWGRIVASVESRYRYQTTNPQIFAGAMRYAARIWSSPRWRKGVMPRRGYSTGWELMYHNIINPADDKAGFTA